MPIISKPSGKIVIGDKEIEITDFITAKLDPRFMQEIRIRQVVDSTVMLIDESTPALPAPKEAT